MSSSAANVRSQRVEIETGDERGDRGTVGVRYLVAGEGPPVVLLHGIGLDAATVSWKHTIPHLAGNRRVLALDLPGHGESDKPPVRYTTEYYQDVLAGFLSALDLDRPDVVGISMGGAIALGHALESPAGVGRLVLADSYGLGEDAYWRKPACLALRTPFMDRFIWSSFGASRRTVERSLRGITEKTPDAFVEDVYDAIQRPGVGRTVSSWQRSEFRARGLKTSYLDRLSELRIRTLLVHGDSDPLVPATWSERAGERIPESEVQIFENCGHWPTRERPARFNSVLARFLSRAG